MATTPFATYFGNRTSATTPLGSTDSLMVLQGGVVKSVAMSSFSGTGSGLNADKLQGHLPGSGNGLDADTVDGKHAICGKIDGSNGAIIAGTGFTASRTGTGQYTITFSPAFASYQITVASIKSNELANTTFVVDSFNTSTTFINTYHTYLSGSTLIWEVHDCASFTFITMGQ